MTDHRVTHATFSIERHYEVPPARVFSAWADAGAKARWFAGPGAAHELDFRIGGREITRGGHPDGTEMTFTTTYHDIVPNERIVYAATLHGGETLATVSLTTVEFAAVGDGTRLTLTEQGAFLDGHEEPIWREQGTGDQLTALEAELLHDGKQER